MPAIPDGDVLLHTGNFSNLGIPREVEAFNEFLGKRRPALTPLDLNTNTNCMIPAAKQPPLFRTYKFTSRSNSCRGARSACTYTKKYKIKGGGEEKKSQQDKKKHRLVLTDGLFRESDLSPWELVYSMLNIKSFIICNF